MTQRPIDYRHNPNNFKTTYNQSFTDVPTFYASPLYQELHQRRQREPEPFDETEAIIRRDAELRELERRKLAEFYRRQAELEEARRENERQRQESPNRNQQQRHESPNRNRPRDESPQRYSYNEPLSHRSRYEDGIASRNNFQQAPISYRNGDMDERLSPRRERISEFIRPDLKPDIDDNFDTERHPRICNRCFKTNVCINKFKCPHQYCDDCLKRLNGAENPFRGAWLWHYKCGICSHDEWCSQDRLTRYDAKGRRIVRYKDVRYFDS